MPINYDHVMGLVETKPVSYEHRDTILYALGVGFGRDPLDAVELAFVYENAGLKTVPTMACVLAVGGIEIVFKSGVNYQLMVHGEQRMVIHAPLPPKGSLTATTLVKALIDKGAGKGAILITECALTDNNAVHYATVSSSAFCRGDGGFGGPKEGAPAPHAIPVRAPDRVVETLTRADQALLYRLSGDYNPLHADPSLAVKVGFPRPILHGLCTYGIVCRQILQHVCGYDTSRLTNLDVRFSNPVLPGETIVTEMWDDPQGVSFRASVKERQLLVLNNGRALLG